MADNKLNATQNYVLSALIVVIFIFILTFYLKL